MTYEEMFKRAKETGDMQTLTPEFYDWKEKGQYVVGKYVTKIEIQSKNNAGFYYQYIFDSNKGRIKFACGKVTDQAIAEALVPGRVYAFVYGGKTEIGGGHTVNDFQVYALGEDEADNGAEILY